MDGNIVKLVVFMLVLVVAVAGCGQKDTKEKIEMTMVKDELGTEKIKKNPRRIVVLEYSFADYLAALDMEPTGIADDDSTKNITKSVRNEIGAYKSVGPRPQPNMEVISKLEPDLITADVDRHKKIRSELNRIAPTVMLVSGTGDYNANIETSKTIAKTVGKKKEGEKRLEKHNKILVEIRKKTEQNTLKSAFASGIPGAGMFINNKDTSME